MGWDSHSYVARNRQQLRLARTFQSNYSSEKGSLPQHNREMGQNENCRSELSDLKNSYGVLSLDPKKAGSRGFSVIQRVVRETGRYREFFTK